MIFIRPELHNTYDSGSRPFARRALDVTAFKIRPIHIEISPSILLPLFLLLYFFSYCPSRAQDQQDCADWTDPASGIAACTAIIESGLEADNGLVWAFLSRGLAHLDLGDSLQAINDFDHILRIDPTLAEVHYGKGLAYDQLGDFRQAAQSYSEALILNPSYASAYLNRGNALAELGELDRALADYTEAAHHDQQMWEA